MKRAIPILAICAGTVLFAAGCSKTENPPLPKEAAQAPSTQGAPSTPAPPTPQLPDPVVTKGAEAPKPTPGQAGDHSSPAFKAGGKTDTTK